MSNGWRRRRRRKRKRSGLIDDLRGTNSKIRKRVEGESDDKTRIRWIAVIREG